MVPLEVEAFVRNLPFLNDAFIIKLGLLCSNAVFIIFFCQLTIIVLIIHIKKVKNKFFALVESKINVFSNNISLKSEFSLYYNLLL